MRPFGIIDAHIHLGAPTGKVYAHGWELKAVLRRLDWLGIERAYSVHHHWLNGRFDEAIEASIRAYDESSGRILFMGAYDPRKEQASLKSLDSCLGHEGFIGVKIHPTMHGVSAEDTRYDPAWRFARDHRLPILSHTWNASAHNPSQWLSLPQLFERYLDKYHEVQFVMGHSGGQGAGRVQAIAMAAKYPNTYLDIAGDIFCLDLIRNLVETIGAERVLFGSDQPWVDPRANLCRIILADIDDRAKRLILRENAVRVFQPSLIAEGQRR